MLQSTLIIALDFPSFEETREFLEPFKGMPLSVKVGMELYNQTGPDIIRYLKQEGYDIFLDLKLHDIPNTVERTMRNLRSLGVSMTNVHAAGGIEMMKAARRGLGPDTTLIAVTQLTSTSQEQMNRDQGIPGRLEDSVIHYAQCAYEAGLDGVVCSPLEASMIKEATHPSFKAVTPGIRLAGATTDDQKRITTPHDAIQNGSDYIVVGRPITHATKPLEAYQAILKEWSA